MVVPTEAWRTLKHAGYGLAVGALLAAGAAAEAVLGSDEGGFWEGYGHYLIGALGWGALGGCLFAGAWYALLQRYPVGWGSVAPRYWGVMAALSAATTASAILLYLDRQAMVNIAFAAGAGALLALVECCKPAPAYRVHPQGWCIVVVVVALWVSATSGLIPQLIVYDWGWPAFAILATCLWLSFRVGSRDKPVRFHRVVLVVGAAFGATPVLELAFNEFRWRNGPPPALSSHVAQLLQVAKASTHADDVYVVVPDRYPSPTAAEQAGYGYSNLNFLDRWLVDRDARTDTPSTTLTFDQIASLEKEGGARWLRDPVSFRAAHLAGMTVDGYMGSYDSLAPLPYDTLDRVTTWRWATAGALLSSRFLYGLGFRDMPTVFDGRMESGSYADIQCAEYAEQRVRMLSRRPTDREQPSLTIMHLYYLHDKLDMSPEGYCVDGATTQHTLDALPLFLEILRRKALLEAAGSRGVWIVAAADEGWHSKGFPHDVWRAVYSSRGLPEAWSEQGIPDYPDLLAEVLRRAFLGEAMGSHTKTSGAPFKSTEYASSRTPKAPASSGPKRHRYGCRV